MSLRAADVHFGFQAFLLAFQCSQMKADTRLAMTTPGIALGKVFNPRKIIPRLLKDGCWGS